MRFYIPLPEPAKLGIDIANLSVATAAIIDYLPKATAVVTFLWAVLRLYELETVQKWVRAIRAYIKAFREK